MKNPKLRILNYVIPLITLLVSIVCYFRLPDQITLSWDLNGAASSYEAKWHLFLMSGMGLVIAILFDILPHVDPRKKNYSKFEHFYDQFCIFMQLFLFGMTAVTLVENFRPGTVNIPLVITIAIGILFLFIGNTNSMGSLQRRKLAQNSPSGRKMLLHGRHHPDPGSLSPQSKTGLWHYVRTDYGGKPGSHPYVLSLVS